MSNVKGVNLEVLRADIPGKVFDKGEGVDDLSISLPVKRGALKWLKKAVNNNGHLSMFGSTGTDDSNKVAVAFGFSGNCFNGDLWEAMQ